MSTYNTEEMLKAKSSSLRQMVQQRRFGLDYQSLQDEVLRLERAVAEERAEPYAAEWSLGAPWNGMAHFPTVLGDGFSCALVFETKNRQCAVLGFRSVIGYKLTDVGDENIQGHSLTGKGLLAYRSFIVKNSPWLKELELIDKVHPQYAEERWRTSQHYLLCFKDRMFETIARDVQLVGVFDAVDEAMKQAAAYLVSASAMT